MTLAQLRAYERQAARIERQRRRDVLMATAIAMSGGEALTKALKALKALDEPD